MKMKRDTKRGISPVIATILLILITVAAVGIIWAALSIWMKGQIGQLDCTKVQDSLEVVTDDGTTCYKDSTTPASSEVRVKIRKSPTDVDISDIQIVVNLESGSTKSVKVVSLGKAVPLDNEAVLYTLTGADYDGAKEVEIAPIIKKGNTVQSCKVGEKVTLPACVA